MNPTKPTKPNSITTTELGWGDFPETNTSIFVNRQKMFYTSLYLSRTQLSLTKQPRLGYVQTLPININAKMAFHGSTL